MVNHLANEKEYNDYLRAEIKTGTIWKDPENWLRVFSDGDICFAGREDYLPVAYATLVDFIEKDV